MSVICPFEPNWTAELDELSSTTANGLVGIIDAPSLPVVAEIL